MTDGPTCTRCGKPLADGAVETQSTCICVSERGLGRDHDLYKAFDQMIGREGAGCWTWRGARNNHGYGRVGNVSYAHRVSWEIHVGPIPPGVYVLHRCDNPPCANPDHLFLGTQADNMADAKRKGRLANRPNRTKGEANPASKLTAVQARQIREMCASGTSQRAAARAFGITQKVVWDIVHDKIWRSA